MNISIVLAVYNNFELTKSCYENLRKKYPTVPIVISDGGSYDDTKYWGNNIQDEYLQFIGCPNQMSFSENYNLAIKFVKTEKLVLVHNDMIFGDMFLENLEKYVDEKTILSYTTIEPPIFSQHFRVGKIVKDFGNSFDNFNQTQFDSYVNNLLKSDVIYHDASFFMCCYKKTFLDIGGFDEKTFIQYFYEDYDFLIRAKLKGYNLKTLSSAMVYHFVSKTSRFGDDYKNKSKIIESSSEKNFVRKWGVPLSEFIKQKYWLASDYSYQKIKSLLISNDSNVVTKLEPFFDNIITNCDVFSYISNEQKYTSVNLNNKFTNNITGEIIFHCDNIKNDITLQKVMSFKMNYEKYQKGKYSVDNCLLEIK